MVGISEIGGDYIETDDHVIITPRDGLLYEAMKGNKDELKKLLEQHADVNMPIRGGWTAPILAAKEGHLDVAKLLVENGADLAAAMLAKSNGHNDVGAYLDSIMRMRDEITNRATDDKGINNKLKPKLSNVLRSR
jgi:ankyrin repeat protein